MVSSYNLDMTIQSTPRDHFDSVIWQHTAVPISKTFADIYADKQGLAESRYVFLQGNNMQARLPHSLHIAELGFGAGLNMFALLDLWYTLGAKWHTHFTSFEAYPMAACDMERIHRLYAELSYLTQAFFLDWWGQTPVDLVWTGYKGARFTAHIVLGDARATLPLWDGYADAWFLDGFAPTRNPELWQTDLLQAVAQHTKQGGTVATYTSSGHVRRALQQSGFDIKRLKGFGHKRHMLAGFLRKQ